MSPQLYWAWLATMTLLLCLPATSGDSVSNPGPASSLDIFQVTPTQHMQPTTSHMMEQYSVNSDVFVVDSAMPQASVDSSEVVVIASSEWMPPKSMYSFAQTPSLAIAPSISASAPGVSAISSQSQQHITVPVLTATTEFIVPSMTRLESTTPEGSTVAGSSSVKGWVISTSSLVLAASSILSSITPHSSQAIIVQASNIPSIISTTPAVSSGDVSSQLPTGASVSMTTRSITPTTTMSETSVTSVAMETTTSPTAAPQFVDSIYVISFKGDCSLIKQSTKLEQAFKDGIVKSIAEGIKVDQKRMKVDKIACGSVNATLTIANTSASDNVEKDLYTYVKSGNFVVKVVDGNSTISYPATSLTTVHSPKGQRIVPTTGPAVAPKTPKPGIVLTEIEKILIIIASVIGGTLILFGIILAFHECCQRKKYKSFDLGETPGPHVKLEDFTLTKMDRPSVIYDEHGLVHANPDAYTKLNETNGANDKDYKMTTNGVYIGEVTSFKNSPKPASRSHEEHQKRSSTENLVQHSPPASPGIDNPSFSGDLDDCSDDEATLNSLTDLPKDGVEDSTLPIRGAGYRTTGLDLEKIYGVDPELDSLDKKTGIMPDVLPDRNMEELSNVSEPLISCDPSEVIVSDVPPDSVSVTVGSEASLSGPDYGGPDSESAPAMTLVHIDTGLPEEEEIIMTQESIPHEPHRPSTIEHTETPGEPDENPADNTDIEHSRTGLNEARELQEADTNVPNIPPEETVEAESRITPPPDFIIPDPPSCPPDGTSSQPPEDSVADTAQSYHVQPASLQGEVPPPEKEENGYNVATVTPGSTPTPVEESATAF